MGNKVGDGGAIPAKDDRFAAGFHGGNKARELSLCLVDVDGNHVVQSSPETMYSQVWSDLIFGAAESLQLGRSQGARREGAPFLASRVSLETALGKNVVSRVYEK